MEGARGKKTVLSGLRKHLDLGFQGLVTMLWAVCVEGTPTPPAILSPPSYAPFHL